MDMKPTLLPLGELQLRKARELKERGYTPTEIAAAMGLRSDRVDELLRDLLAQPDATAAQPQTSR
jgi:hypothetical protein